MKHLGHRWTSPRLLEIFFMIDVKSLLIESIKYAIETEEMSTEQRRGIIT